MKKRQILVELTPLLDVILIMLFVLLVQSRTQVTKAAGETRDAEAEAALLRGQLASVTEELDAAVRRERALTVVEEESLIVTLSVQDGPVRRVRIETEGGGESFVALDGARLAESREKLRRTILDAAGGSGVNTVFLVFQYDRNGIYHAEYELISGVISELKPELMRDGIYLNVIELDTKE